MPSLAFRAATYHLGCSVRVLGMYIHGVVVQHSLPYVEFMRLKLLPLMESTACCPATSMLSALLSENLPSTMLAFVLLPNARMP